MTHHMLLPEVASIAPALALSTPLIKQKPQHNNHHNNHCSYCAKPLALGGKRNNVTSDHHIVRVSEIEISGEIASVVSRPSSAAVCSRSRRLPALAICPIFCLPAPVVASLLRSSRHNDHPQGYPHQGVQVPLRWCVCVVSLSGCFAASVHSGGGLCACRPCRTRQSGSVLSSGCAVVVVCLVFAVQCQSLLLCV